MRSRAAIALSAGILVLAACEGPVPPPPAADEWAFVFVPGDSY